MPSRKKVRFAFGGAVVFLLIAALAAGVAISRLTQSLRWIAHTYEVQVAVGELTSILDEAGRARAKFDDDADAPAQEIFNQIAGRVPEKIDDLRRLVRDNPAQDAALGRLQDAALRRLAAMHSRIERRKLGSLDSEELAASTRQLVALGAESQAAAQEMMNNEQQLLVTRRSTSTALYGLLIWILILAFVVSLTLLYLYYQMLESELSERERAESLALESQASSRLLSTRLLHLQDEERRKFSRELHDSLGQYLAAAKMSLDALARGRNPDESLDGARAHLEQALAETRTISYLLHPPLLDETGLGMATRWYVEGFARRSGIAFTCEVPDDFPRLAHPVELALFRVLQECLTNIHRHAKSSRAVVSLNCTPSQVLLRVRDYGGGMSPEVLRRFRSNGTHVGVGLAGMRERVREQQGNLDIQSDSAGVTVVVTVPFVPEEPQSSDAESVSTTQSGS
jgi:signal transduction histidine kinase